MGHATGRLPPSYVETTRNIEKTSELKISLYTGPKAVQTVILVMRGVGIFVPSLAAAVQKRCCSHFAADCQRWLLAAVMLALYLR